MWWSGSASDSALKKECHWANPCDDVKRAWHPVWTAADDPATQALWTGICGWDDAYNPTDEQCASLARSSVRGASASSEVVAGDSAPPPALSHSALTFWEAKCSRTPTPTPTASATVTPHRRGDVGGAGGDGGGSDGGGSDISGRTSGSGSGSSGGAGGTPQSTVLRNALVGVAMAVAAAASIALALYRRPAAAAAGAGAVATQLRQWWAGATVWPSPAAPAGAAAPVAAAAAAASPAPAAAAVV